MSSFFSSSSKLAIRNCFLQLSPLSLFNHFKASIWLIFAEWCHYLIPLLKNTHSTDSPPLGTLFTCIKSFVNLCLQPYYLACPATHDLFYSGWCSLSVLWHTKVTLTFVSFPMVFHLLQLALVFPSLDPNSAPLYGKFIIHFPKNNYRFKNTWPTISSPFFHFIHITILISCLSK